MNPYIAVAAVLLTFALPLRAGDLAPDQGLGSFVLPQAYRDFRLIGISQRSDDPSLRAILGNAVAIDAVRSGATNPWPEGTILVKLTWKHRQSPEFPAALVPGEFAGAAFMIKDAVKYAATGGWGWSERTGLAQASADRPGAAAECVRCHALVRERDLVFTQPARLP